MSIFKRGEIWWVEVKVGGIRIRESAGPQATQKDARELEARIRARALDDRLQAKMGKTPCRTFDEALLRWLKDEGSTLKDPGLRARARLVLPHIKGVWLEQVPDASANMRQKFIAQGLKPATINRRLAIIRRVLNCAYDWGWVTEKVGRRIKLLAEHNERYVYLTRDEVMSLAAAAGDAGPMIWQLAYTGLRLSELFRLTADNVVGDVIALSSNTKSGKPRIVPIHSEIAHYPIPVTITRNQFRRRFEEARVKIGKPGLHAHDLRHTFASWLVQSGASMTAVRDLMGHAHLGVTSRYAHLHDDHLRAALKKVGHKKAHTKKSRNAE